MRTTTLVVGLMIVAGVAALASEPAAAPFRSAFLAQFPKSGATGAALELEAIAAALGINLVPALDQPGPPGASPGTPAINGDRRPRPSAEMIAAYQRVSPVVSEFVERELKAPEERIGAPPEPVERFLDEHDGELTAAESALLRGADLRWEMDVDRGFGGPLPNFLGHLQLVRLLVARTLLVARRGDVETGLQTLEAAWRIIESDSARPELISHLILLAAARLEVGALRKLDAPAYGWVDRLRDGRLFSGFLAAFQNEVWFDSEIQDLTGEGGAYGRALRQIAEEFQREDLCAWTPARLREIWDRSFRDNYPEDLAGAFHAPNLIVSLERWRRYLVDAELTALVLDARAERAASRKHAWPEKLLSVGRGVCPDAAWSYHPSARGTAVFAFGGRIVEGPSRAIELPLTFTAGVPAPPPPLKPTPRPSPR